MEYTNNTNNTNENEYLRLVKYILDNGRVKGDRTGTGTLSIFGYQCRYDLTNNKIPLLTTKKMFVRGIIEELLWFIRGSTNSKELENLGINIWKYHGSKNFRPELEYPDGELGPTYGYQWRKFGERDGIKGIDQLKKCIEEIKSNPNSRRLIITSWNPHDIDQIKLPPCHCLMQFYIIDNELSCQMYQRSADVGIGVPFNILSYSLLTCMISHICNLKPGYFIHSLGDVHIYLNHIDKLKEQLTRIPFKCPVLKLKDSVKDIDEFSIEDFQIVGYNHHSELKMDMAK